MTRRYPLAGLLVCLAASGCAVDTQVSEVSWLRPDRNGRPCHATSSGLYGACMAGPDDVANTYVTRVYRLPDPPPENTSCRRCLRGECELVATMCRCGPGSADLQAHFEALEGQRFGDLPPGFAYCFAVVTLYVEGNEPPSGEPGQCPASFTCEGAADPGSEHLAPGARTCSVSEWGSFPGQVATTRHVCRDDPEVTAAGEPPGIGNCLDVPPLCE